MKKPKTLFVTSASADRPCRKPTLTHQMYKGPAGERRDRSVMYADEVYEVPNDRFHRRRIAKGDLKEVEGPARQNWKKAAAPKSKPTTTEKKAAKKSEKKGSDR